MWYRNLFDLPASRSEAGGSARNGGISLALPLTTFFAEKVVRGLRRQ